MSKINPEISKVSSEDITPFESAFEGPHVQSRTHNGDAGKESFVFADFMMKLELTKPYVKAPANWELITYLHI